LILPRGLSEEKIFLKEAKLKIYFYSGYEKQILFSSGCGDI
jgi:hypothetical protein